ncbi:hypothetical protein PISL3812_03501 [Talaromyces islandicus]|uniref:Uncharacterized protein n=1 Tax=Talaromyces islandicus TaxID=28573 RepID=A0A0U1LTB9_TALIS|nr:hypothetical protein PISL3812_03501 [Talaromyces islandicus]
MIQQGTILVTGTNGGLGNAIVSHILNHQVLNTNYYGIYTVRNPMQGATTVRRTLEKAESVKHAHELLTMDLSSLESVRRAAREINNRVATGALPPIRALILNAGWGEQTTHSFTNDGFDMSFQVNYLSHFLLTLLLLQSMDKKHGRIKVFQPQTQNQANIRAVSTRSTTDPNNKKGPSAAMYTPRQYQQIFNYPINTEDLAKGKWSSENAHPGDLNAGLRRYGAAKLCEVMMFRELSTRIEKDPELSAISVVAVDPGAMPSDLNRRSIWVMFLLMKFVLPLLAPLAVWLQPNGTIRTTTKSARDVVRAAFDTTTLGEHPNGIYLNGSEISDVGPEAKDVEKSKTLWHDSLGYAQLEKGDTILKVWQ